MKRYLIKLLKEKRLQEVNAFNTASKFVNTGTVTAFEFWGRKKQAAENNIKKIDKYILELETDLIKTN